MLEESKESQYYDKSDTTEQKIKNLPSLTDTYQQ